MAIQGKKEFQGVHEEDLQKDLHVSMGLAGTVPAIYVATQGHKMRRKQAHTPTPKSPIPRWAPQINCAPN